MLIAVDLLSAHVVIFALRHAVCRHTVTQNGRADKHHQVTFFFFIRRRFKQVTNQRDITQQRHFRHAFSRLVVHQTAKHDQLTIVSQHGGFQFALAKHDIEAGLPFHFRDFLLNHHLYRVTFVNLRRDFQHDADFFPLYRIERIAVIGANGRAG